MTRPRLEPGPPRGGKPATNRLNYGAALPTNPYSGGFTPSLCLLASNTRLLSFLTYEHTSRQQREGGKGKDKRRGLRHLRTRQQSAAQWRSTAAGGQRSALHSPRSPIQRTVLIGDQCVASSRDPQLAPTRGCPNIRHLLHYHKSWNRRRPHRHMCCYPFLKLISYTI
jgi:hypothetical protein